MSQRPLSCSARVSCLIAIACLVPTGESVAGAWKERTQVVWSKETSQLIRKSIRIWDPHPELDLDFLWQPRAALRGGSSTVVASGPGTLTWHVRGAAAYDRK